MATQEQTTQVLQLYTAYFNRAADKAGVDYWLNEMLNNGWTINDVALTFSQQVEYTNVYTGLSHTQIVAQVYINVLNRSADAAGATYWSGELSNGNIGVSQLVQAVITAATETDEDGDFKNQSDALLFNNKIDASSYAYGVGSNATTLSLSTITIDSNTVENVKSQINLEPNDEKAMATSITLALAQQGISGSINVTDVTDSADWYKITLDAAGTYTAYIELLTGTTDSSTNETYLKVYDSSGTVLLNIYTYGYLDKAGDWNRNTFQANLAGDYYIQIERDYNLDAFYNLSIQPSIANGLVQVDTEPNDEKAMATSITLALAQQGISGSINVTDVTDSADWYKITLDAAGTYTAYIELLTGTTDSSTNETYLKVYDSSGTVLLNIYTYGYLDKAGDWNRNTFQANLAGDYYIQIERDYNLDAFYNLSIQPSIANGLVQVDTEPNDEKAMATSITLALAQQGISGSINVTDVTDSADWYKITLDAAGTYTAYIELLTGTTDSSTNETYLKVYDSSGTVLLNIYTYGYLDKAGDWNRNTFQANLAGDYYIQIERDYNLDAFYNLSIQPSIANGLVQVDTEPNDEKAMATPITLALAQQGISGSINVTDVTDSADWYKITLDAAGTYTAYIELLTGTTDSSTNETYLKVYDSSGTVLLNIYTYGYLDKAGDWNRNTFQANLAGDYYIQIERDYNLDAFYNLSIQPSIANGLVQVDTEPNDEKAMATSITLALAQQGISGSINVTDVTDSADWYKITLDAAGTYTAYIELLTGTTDSSTNETYLKVYDSSGTVVLNNYAYGNLDNTGDWDRDTFQANLAGDYYIQIERDYNLDTFYNFSIAIA